MESEEPNVAFAILLPKNYPSYPSCPSYPSYSRHTSVSQQSHRPHHRAAGALGTLVGQIGPAVVVMDLVDRLIGNQGCDVDGTSTNNPVEALVSQMFDFAIGDPTSTVSTPHQIAQDFAGFEEHQQLSTGHMSGAHMPAETVTLS